MCSVLQLKANSRLIKFLLFFLDSSNCSNSWLCLKNRIASIAIIKSDHGQWSICWTVNHVTSMLCNLFWRKKTFWNAEKIIQKFTLDLVFSTAQISFWHTNFVLLKLQKTSSSNPVKLVTIDFCYSVEMNSKKCSSLMSPEKEVVVRSFPFRITGISVVSYWFDSFHSLNKRAGILCSIRLKIDKFRMKW